MATKALLRNSRCDLSRSYRVLVAIAYDLAALRSLRFLGAYKALPLRYHDVRNAEVSTVRSRETPWNHSGIAVRSPWQPHTNIAFPLRPNCAPRRSRGVVWDLTAWECIHSLKVVIYWLGDRPSTPIDLFIFTTVSNKSHISTYPYSLRCPTSHNYHLLILTTVSNKSRLSTYPY